MLYWVPEKLMIDSGRAFKSELSQQLPKPCVIKKISQHHIIRKQIGGTDEPN